MFSQKIGKIFALKLFCTNLSVLTGSHVSACVETKPEWRDSKSPRFRWIDSMDSIMGRLWSETAGWKTNKRSLMHSVTLFDGLWIGVFFPRFIFQRFLLRDAIHGHPNCKILLQNIPFTTLFHNQSEATALRAYDLWIWGFIAFRYCQGSEVDDNDDWWWDL